MLNQLYLRAIRYSSKMGRERKRVGLELWHLSFVIFEMHVIKMGCKMYCDLDHG